ncbi:ATP-binding protein [Bradyrhizobium diazoefficiens]|uniref:ATP-binding protein n=1 Tax=Bradyrhizobium diazoefficiens TaxID=1355477 RepID=UPI0027145E14|nr:ATP-binding protein [Bradyrhizobium diazoefficiens]WLC19331.1 ATP-binding protein [Bradyrhizobium diazoefficiens]
MAKNLFTPGASADAAPAGDVERQAIASLRGYAYQVAAAALAWLDIDADARVYLEVAEDYATVAQNSLDAVQVKDTAVSGSITLNSEAVRDAINAFVFLTGSNKDRHVQLRYLTTSTIGTEQRIADRPSGEAGLIYWRKAAAGAEVGPLRAILTSNKFSAEVHAFVNERNDEALRRDLLHRVHWECGKPDISGIVHEFEERLVVLCRDRFNLAAIESKQLANILLHHVLKKSVLSNASERYLTRAELYSTIDAASLVSVPRRTIGSALDVTSVLASALSGGQSLTAVLSAIETSWLIPRGDFATPRAIIVRDKLVNRIEQVLTKFGCVFLVGGSGLGKSLLAREVAGRLIAGFITIDVRDVGEGEAARRLGLALGRIGALDFDCLIFDDFNHIEDGKARLGFGRCMQALARRDRRAIVTAYRRPSNRALTELGLVPDAVINIPYLTEEEAGEVVQAAGGDPAQWGRLSFTAGAQGHPQLVHAFAMGMRAREWPLSEVREIVIRGFASDDTDAEREAARRSMTASLSDDARALLYRMSLVIGRFDRALALKIAEVPPPIQRSGELLDALIGAWIETVGKEGLRVSPLAANAGRGMFTDNEQEAIHATIARQMVQQSSIKAVDANGILMHGLLGKDDGALARLAYMVLMAESSTDQLREQFFALPLLNTEQPIVPTNIAVSILLRLAQFKLIASGDDRNAIAACATALLREASEEENEQLRDMFEGMSLASILNTMGIASALPNWVELLQRFKEKAASNSTLRHLRETADAIAEAEGRTFFGMTVSIGTAHMQSIERLEQIFVDLDRLPDADRVVWLESFERHPDDYALLVNPSWAAEAGRNELNADDAAIRFKRMALLAQRWNLPRLASQCFVACAVMFDEYLHDKANALATLDAAEAAIGADVALVRARARVYWRNREYKVAVDVYKTIADEIGRDSPIDRAFAMREGSISAAAIGEWAQAAEWFDEADKAAATAQTDDMKVMAIGLQADRAVALLESGNVEEALRAMASCLHRLSEADPSQSLRAGYCHRVVRHTVLWMDSKIDRRETLIDGKPIQMLPGTCSNPEPPASILDLPLAPIDSAWYMLAEAEASSGLDAGITTSLHSRLRNGPISFLEISLRIREISRSIADSDVTGFSRRLSPYICAMEYLRTQPEKVSGAFDIMNPPRGEIPQLTIAELAEPTVAHLANDALTAFNLSSVLNGRPSPTLDLHRGLTLALGQDFPGKTFLESWRHYHAELTGLDGVVIEGISQLRSGEYLTPRQLWEIGLRFFEKVRQSSFRKVLVPLLRVWLREQWKDIIANGSFRLCRPMQTVPEIEERLSRDSKDEAFIAAVLLAASNAVGSPLAAAYEAQLKGVADGDR